MVRHPWFWLYVLTAACAAAFCAFAAREGFASDAEMRAGGWVVGQTVTLAVGLISFVVATLLRRRSGR